VSSELINAHRRRDLALDQQCPTLAVVDPGVGKASAFHLLLTESWLPRKLLLIYHEAGSRRRSVRRKHPQEGAEKSSILGECGRERMRDAVLHALVLIEDVAHELPRTEAASTRAAATSTHRFGGVE
jgi:hypothetical protein